MNLFARLVRSELRLFLRDPMSAGFTLVFPSLLVVILGCIPPFREPVPELGGLRVIDLYVPIAVALVLATLSLQFAPQVLATYRERGVLRRLATTPVRPASLLAAQLTMSVLMAVVSGVLVLLVGRLAFAVAFPRQLLGYLVAFLLSAGAVFAIGLVIAALAPSGKAANGIGTLLFFPAMFFAGLWTPREGMPEVLQRIGDFTPLGAGVQALHEGFTGHWPAVQTVIVLLAYLAVFGFAAARLFRWE